jgi:hypothetical protein
VPGTLFEVKGNVVVETLTRTTAPPERLVESFPLTKVTLDRDAQGRDTPFIKNRDKFLRGLAVSNPDNFLFNFRETFGQAQPDGVKALGGWDSQTTKLRGHASGHYLSAIAQAYASTGYDPALQAEFLKKMNYLVDTLYDLSQKSGKPTKPGGPSNADPVAVPVGEGHQTYDSNFRAGQIRTDYWNWGTGFISAYPPDQFIMLEKGATYGGQDSQIWAPYYTLHKILAGLLDTYEVAGNKKALDIARGMGAWVNARLAALPDDTRIRMWSRYIAGEYGGMNEAMARLFRLTGDRKFLDTAKLFDNTNFFYGNAAHEGGLAKNVDTVRGRHANQHIPQITGALETYRNTKEMPYYQIATNFWEIVNDGYMYSIGAWPAPGIPNNAECFTGQPNSLWENGLATGGQNETCATVQPAEARSPAVHVRPDGEVHGPLRARALQPHPGVRGGAGRGQHLSRAAQPGRAQVVRQRQHERLHLLQRNGARKLHQAAGHDLLPQRRPSGAVRQSVHPVDAELGGAQGRRSADHRLPVRRHDEARHHGIGPVRRERARARLGDSRRGGEDQRARRGGEGDAGVVSEAVTHLARQRHDRNEDAVHVPSRSLDGSAERGQPLLRSGAARGRGGRRTHRLAPGRAGCGDISKSITGDPATLRFQIAGVPFKPFYETYGRHSVYVHVTFK